MALTSVGVYEFNAKDLIGHGAFAVVYRGRKKLVSIQFYYFKYLLKTGNGNVCPSKSVSNGILILQNR